MQGSNAYFFALVQICVLVFFARIYGFGFWVFWSWAAGFKFCKCLRFGHDISWRICFSLVFADQKLPGQSCGWLRGCLGQTLCCLDIAMHLQVSVYVWRVKPMKPFVCCVCLFVDRPRVRLRVHRSEFSVFRYCCSRLYGLQISRGFDFVFVAILHALRFSPVQGFFQMC